MTVAPCEYGNKEFAQHIAMFSDPLLKEAAERILNLEAQVATARQTVEDFKRGLYKVPDYSKKVNGNIRMLLAEAYSPVLNLPAVLDRLSMQKGGGK